MLIKLKQGCQGDPSPIMTDDLYLFLKINLFIILLYNIVLVLPYIDMNQPWVHMCSPS